MMNYFSHKRYPFISCKKEHSYEGCKETDSPPIAIQGLTRLSLY